MTLSFLEPELRAIGDRSLHRENRNFRPRSSVTLILTGWHSYTNLTRTPGRYTGCANMNFLRQGFRKLSSDRHTDGQTSYAWSLPVTWQRWLSHQSMRRSRQTHAAHRLDGSVFYRTGVIGDRSLHCENRHFEGFRLLWPWPWPDDLHIQIDPYCLAIYRMCKYELPTSRFSKVIVW